jgi:hypothetical protein
MIRKTVMLLALAAALPAHAQRVSQINGNRLMALCRTAELAGCDAYLAGVADAIAEEPPPHIACIPPVVTAAQLRAVVLKLLHDEPDKRALPAVEVVIHAYEKAFACHP